MFQISRGLRIIRYLLDKRKTIELFGWFESNNLGDEAMLFAGYKTLPSNRVIGNVRSTKIKILNKLLLKSFKKNLIVGGGTLIHGGGVNGENPWLDYIEKRIEQGSEVSFFGTGISLTDSQIRVPNESVLRWKKILNESKNVYLRGPLSQKTANLLGINANIFGDFIFSLYDSRLCKEDLQSNDSDIIGINVGESLGDQNAYEYESSYLIGKLKSQYKIIFFVVTPHDNDSLDRIIAMSGIHPSNYDVHRIYKDPNEFMFKVKVCHAFIGIKLHACGLAMIVGIPTLLVAYKEKCRDFVLPLDLEHCLLELPLDREDYINKVNELLTFPERFQNKSKIEMFAEMQKTILSSNFKK